MRIDIINEIVSTEAIEWTKSVFSRFQSLR
jgi:hypothetical protein